MCDRHQPMNGADSNGTRASQTLVTCLICGQMRPPDKISNWTNKWTDPQLGEVEETIRYCSDKAECGTAAPKVHLVGVRKGAAMQRHQRAPGE